MRIGGLQKITLIDYPGKVAATVFFIGCNFRCRFCYNSDLVLPEKIKKQKTISPKTFFNFLKSRKNLLEGVCIGGGEPTIYKNLPEFIKKIKKMGFWVKLDTNGTNPKMLKQLIDKKLIDYVAMDIKAPKGKYEEVVGKKINIKNIEESIKILKKGKVDYEFRTTIVPTLHAKEDIIKIVQWIKPAQKYFLQNFLQKPTIDKNLEKIKPYPKEFLLEIQKEIAPFFEICKIR
jgi:pyruvate formate lyase activating enzyme